MTTSDSFLMDSLSDSLVAAVTETSFDRVVHPPVAGKLYTLKLRRKHGFDKFILLRKAS